jgi:GAF domain-containing protein
MIRLLADENFNGDVLEALMRAEPTLDVIRAQDIELYQSPDPIVLEWAAREGRILLTHDVKTMTRFAADRIKADLPMPGVIEVRIRSPIGIVVEDILIVLLTSRPGELNNRVIYVPLK